MTPRPMLTLVFLAAMLTPRAEWPSPAAEPVKKADAQGDALPGGVLLRIGSTRLRHGGYGADSDRDHREKNVFEFSHFLSPILFRSRRPFFQNSRGLYYFASPCGIPRFSTPQESASPAKTA